MIKTKFSDQLHADKYRARRESFKEAMNRIASTLTVDEMEFHEFRDILLGLRFMPGGRIQAAMGATKRVTPYNCFVSGTIEDSFVEGEGSIMARAAQAAATMRLGGGIGYDFSTLRPKGDLIRKLGSRSSGPLSFMHIYDAICRCVASSGHRRGAQMGILRVDHPDIEAFVHAKQNLTELLGFNLSIGITDKFMEAVVDGKEFKLKWGGRVYQEIDAKALWEMIMRSTWDWAEPGVLFIDTINRMNNLYYCEKIAATNPCGEQPLPPFGACLLGSFNLVKYVTSVSENIHAAERQDLQQVGMRFHFDFDQLKADIPVVVRAMDNVIEEAVFPLYEQEKEAKSKRRMGLGITGLANALELLGYPYGSERFVEFTDTILGFINQHAYRASAELAAERGPFPLYDRDKYLEAPFIKKLDYVTRQLIAKNGIRNSHLTSIAPTGTISLCADNVSSGIEPVFAYEYDREIYLPEGRETVTVKDYAVREFGVRGRIAQDVTVDQHLAVLLAAAKNVDSAVSKTCNVPPDTDWETFKQIYIRAWQGGAKGCTTFQVGGKRFGILTTNEDGASSCRIDPETGRKECD